MKDIIRKVLKFNAIGGVSCLFATLVAIYFIATFYHNFKKHEHSRLNDKQCAVYIDNQSIIEESLPAFFIVLVSCSTCFILGYNHGRNIVIEKLIQNKKFAK